MSAQRKPLKCDSKVLTANGCTTELAQLTHAKCIPDNASLLFCNPTNNRISYSKINSSGTLECTDSLLAFSAGGCLTQRSVSNGTSIPCDGLQLMTCQDGALSLGPVNSASGIECEASFLLCQNGVLTEASLQPATTLELDAQFLVCQNGRLETTPLFAGTSVTAAELACDAAFLVIQDGVLEQAQISTGTSISLQCDDAFLVCAGNQLALRPLAPSSCDSLDCELTDVVICDGGQLGRKSLAHFLSSTCDGSFPLGQGDQVISFANIPRLNCNNKLTLCLSAESEFEVSAIVAAPAFIALCPPTASGNSLSFTGLLPTLPLLDCDQSQVLLRISASSAEALSVDYILSIEPTGPAECSTTNAECPEFFSSALGSSSDLTPLQLVLPLGTITNLAVLALAVGNVASSIIVTGSIDGGPSFEFTQLSANLAGIPLYLFYGRLLGNGSSLIITVQPTLASVLVGIASTWNSIFPIVTAGGSANVNSSTAISVDNGSFPCVAFDAMVVDNSSPPMSTAPNQTTIGTAAFDDTFTLASSRQEVSPNPLSWSWMTSGNASQLTGLIR